MNLWRIGYEFYRDGVIIVILAFIAYIAIIKL